MTLSIAILICPLFVLLMTCKYHIFYTFRPRPYQLQIMRVFCLLDVYSAAQRNMGKDCRIYEPSHGTFVHFYVDSRVHWTSREEQREKQSERKLLKSQEMPLNDCSRSNPAPARMEAMLMRAVSFSSILLLLIFRLTRTSCPPSVQNRFQSQSSPTWYLETLFKCKRYIAWTCHCPSSLSTCPN